MIGAVSVSSMESHLFFLPLDLFVILQPIFLCSVALSSGIMSLPTYSNGKHLQLLLLAHHLAHLQVLFLGQHVSYICTYWEALG